jgi:dipeptidyl aminopeptidase/acylaminoacyl peptidase
MLDLTQLLQIPHVDVGLDISPDGSHVAFAWNKTGEWQIYELELPIGQKGRVRRQEEAQQITFMPGGKFNPRYSPDGTRLSYALDFDGSESYHLFVYNRLTGEHTDLTPGISYALQPNFCWSPDGNQLVILSDQHGHFSAYTIPASGGNPQLVLDAGHPAWQVEWSPDGRHLAVCCEMHGQDYGIFVVDVETKDVIELCEWELEQNNRAALLNAHAPAWSPDGGTLAFHADPSGWFEIGFYNLKSEEITWMGSEAGNAQTPVFFPQPAHTDSVRFQVAYTKSRGAINWMETPGEEEARKTFQVGRGIHNGMKATPDCKQLLTIFSSPSQPPDLWSIDLKTGQATQLTNSLPVELAKAEFAMPEEIEYPGLDDVPVPALLFRPKQTPSPAVVMIHGGPNWHYSAEWNPLMAHLASRGYAVLAPNYRGSTGYGRDWQYAARFDLGGVDTRDVAAGAYYLIREGIADRQRIAVTGRSHGGYLTMTCLTQYPGLWCGGSAVVPFLNWFRSHEESREDLQHWNIENMGDPQENYEKWYQHSPYFFLDRVRAPVQLICGGNDPRCPASDSLDARDKLVELGKQVELILFEDEGHIFLNLRNVIHSETRRAKFLADAFET